MMLLSWVSDQSHPRGGVVSEGGEGVEEEEARRSPSSWASIAGAWEGDWIQNTEENQLQHQSELG